MSCSVGSEATVGKDARRGAVLPVLQVFPMALNEVDEVSLENLETAKRLADLMVSGRGGWARHPQRRLKVPLLHPVFLSNVSSSGAEKL